MLNVDSWFNGSTISFLPAQKVARLAHAFKAKQITILNVMFPFLSMKQLEIPACLAKPQTNKK